jgi:hypothetical protein
MSFEKLSSTELAGLVTRVFAPAADERRLLVFIDLPDERLPDHGAWSERRAMAQQWARTLEADRAEHGFSTSLVVYPNVRANNADLPQTVWAFTADAVIPDHASALDPSTRESLADILGQRPLILAPTELSATAPLKMLAREHGFRAATMPGFSAAMIPALRLDYGEVNRRVELFKEELDRAERAEILFRVAGAGEQRLTLDLRHRLAHASGGLLHTPGTAGNLPSGEAYIVPYEGEISGDASGSEGVLPVQLDGEVVLYQIRGNRAVSVQGSGPVARREAELIVREPAYANLAELGLGVLGALGVKPVGEVLLDEKLGLHIAFGRSEHFGGTVAPSDFSGPDAVTHQDRVYLPEIQPDVEPVEMALYRDGERTVPLIADGTWVYPF